MNTHIYDKILDICDYEDNIIDPTDDTVDFYLPKIRRKIS